MDTVHSMKAIELIGDIDEQHRLHARVPTEIPAGQVRLIVFLPGEDEAGGLWANGVASEWSAELSDSREDIYTVDDGQMAGLVDRTCGRGPGPFISAALRVLTAKR